VYNKVEDGMKTKLENKLVCLTSDSWTNIRGEAVVNYMVSAENAEYFVEAQPSGTQSHTSQWLAKDIARVIHSSTFDVVGVVTDNTAANKAAWRLLAEEFPKKFFYGDLCAFFSSSSLLRLCEPLPTFTGEGYVCK
jgi:hypothetical protein